MPLPIEAMLELVAEGSHDRSLVAIGCQVQAKAAGEIGCPNRADFGSTVEHAAAAVVSEHDGAGSVSLSAFSVDLLRRAALPFDSDAIRHGYAPGHNDKKRHRERFHAADGSAKGVV